MVAQNGKDFMTSFFLYGGIFVITMIIFCLIRPRFPLFFAPRVRKSWEKLLDKSLRGDPERQVFKPSEGEKTRHYQHENKEDPSEEKKNLETRTQDGKKLKYSMHPEIFQQSNPDAHNLERLVGEDGVDEEAHPRSFADDVPNSDTFFGWVGTVYSFPLERIQKERGSEAAMYIRWQESAIVFFLLLTVLAFITVVPANAVQGNKNLNPSNPLSTDGLEVISMANVPYGANVFWFHGVMTLIFTLLAILCYSWDYSFSQELTRAYRALPLPQHASVILDKLNPRILLGTTIQEKEESLRQHFATKHGEVEAVHLARLDPKLQAFHREFRSDKKKFAQECEKRDRGKAIRTHGCPGFKKAVDHYAQAEDNLYKSASLVVLRQQQKTAPLTNVGFVTFKSHATAHTFFENNKRDYDLNGDNVVVRRGPQRGAVNWKHLGVPQKNRWIRTLVVNALVFLLSVFWSIPVAFIQSLGHLREIGQNKGFGWLIDVLDFLGEGIETFLNQAIPAILLAIILFYIPKIIRNLSIWEGRRSLVQTDKWVMRRYIFFLMVNVIFVTTAAGTFYDKVQSIFSGEEDLADVLANSLATKGSFFIAYFLVLTLLMATYKLLKLVKFLIVYIFRAPRNRMNCQKIWLFKPGTINYPKRYAKDVVIFTLAMIFSILDPFILPFAFAYFVVSYFVNKYNIIYATRQRYEPEGQMLRGIYNSFFAGLIIFQATMIAFLALKGSRAYIIVIISIVMTVILAILIKLHVRKGKFSWMGLFDHKFSDRIYNRSIGFFEETKTSQGDSATWKNYYRQPFLVPIDEP